jgi:uncharacterized protein (DUF1684 family)
MPSAHTGGMPHRTLAAFRTGAPVAQQDGVRVCCSRRLGEDAVPRVLRLIGLLPLLLAGQSPAADDAYAAEVHEWQREHETDVRTGGWLLLIGRYEVEPGAASIGSDPSSTMILPEGAPPRLGVLTRAASVFRFEPAPGLAVTIDGAPATGIAELSTVHGKGRVAAGSFSFAVRPIGDGYYVLAQNSENPSARNFKGTEWFPVDPAYRVRAEFVAYPQAQSVPVPMTHIESRTILSSTGDVIFRLHGTRLRLKTFMEDDKLFIMFRDPSNGRESYGGGRFLYAPLPQDGATTLDFNKAFNPFCSVNDLVVCAVVPPENRLGVSVAAGQKYRATESH